MLVKLGAAAAALASVSFVQQPFGCSPPPAHLAPCVATISAPQPAQYSTELVYVTTGYANSPVSATAYYRTTQTAHAGRASATGHITIAFRISDATIGYRVVVSVNDSSGGRTGHCSTSFVPKAR